MKFFVHGKTFLPELIASWRVVVLIVVAQIIGGVIGLLNDQYEFWFLNLWMGAAMATLPGVVLGIGWGLASEPASIWNHKGLVSFFLFMGVALFAVAIFILPTLEMQK